MGFCCGPPMMALVRQTLPPDLADSRALRQARHGEPMRMAGLVAAADGPQLVLLDEYGFADVETTPGVEHPGLAELVTVEGAAHVRLGAAVLKAVKAEAWHPGILPLHRQGAA